MTEAFLGLCVGGPLAGEWLAAASARHTALIPKGVPAGPPYEEFTYRHTSIEISTDGFVIDRLQFWVPADAPGDPRVWALASLMKSYSDGGRKK